LALPRGVAVPAAAGAEVAGGRADAAGEREERHEPFVQVALAEVEQEGVPVVSGDHVARERGGESALVGEILRAPQPIAALGEDPFDLADESLAVLPGAEVLDDRE